MPIPRATLLRSAPIGGLIAIIGLTLAGCTTTHVYRGGTPSSADIAAVRSLQSISMTVEPVSDVMLLRAYQSTRVP